MTTNSPLAIEATGLVKSFGETRAVDGVNLAVRAGSVYGVLGPNGAGKTTTIRMLAPAPVARGVVPVDSQVRAGQVERLPSHRLLG